MLIGQTIYAPDSDPGVAYYSPWFPRQGDAFTVVIEVMKSSGAFLIEVQVQTKNQEQPDSAAAALGAAFNITGAGTTPALRSGALELVRYQFTASTEAVPAWVHFRSNPPQWQPN